MFLLTICGSLGLGIGLFVAIPNLLTDWIFQPLTDNRIALNLIEGAVKLAIFIAYVYIIGRRKNIKRVFEYHGAEHKVVYAAENGRPLDARRRAALRHTAPALRNRLRPDHGFRVGDLFHLFAVERQPSAASWAGGWRCCRLWRGFPTN